MQDQNLSWHKSMVTDYVIIFLANKKKYIAFMMHIAIITDYLLVSFHDLHWLLSLELLQFFWSLIFFCSLSAIFN